VLTPTGRTPSMSGARRARAGTVALAAVLAVGSAVPAQAAPQPSRPGESAPGYGPDRFDVQAHRGGLGLTVENTLPAFAHALELGVTTLELDVHITADGHPVVTHDRVVLASKCQDTGPAVPEDPEYPYVGKLVWTLTLAQIRTLDCGSLQQNGFPRQQPAPGAGMPVLSEVFDLVDDHRAHRVRFNIETKHEAPRPGETASREQFVETVAQEVRAAGLLDRVVVQSFDWGALMLRQQIEPALPVAPLASGPFLEVGQPGASPWLGGLDIDDFGGDPVAAAASFGADVFQPIAGYPGNGSIANPGYEPFVTADMVRRAHQAGMSVVSWGVDDRATMDYLLDSGLDGMITNYPDVLRDAAADRGYKLPKAFPARGDGRV
jgi:glycerophosphoryl diester phosphodiesterase